MTETVHTTREIEALIPHRWPFLLVDRIVEYDAEAQRIVGIKGVTASEWYFQGHFPGLPVMPGVIQVEALAQTMAVYVAKQPGFGDRIGLFAGIDDCRFKRVVSPGDTLRLEVTMEKLGGRFGRGRGVASVDGEVACEATLSFIIPARRRRCDDPADRAVRRARQRRRARGGPQGDPRPRSRTSSRSPATSCSTARIRPGRSTCCARWRPTGAAIISGNTDIAVADFDYAAAVPVDERRRPGHLPGGRRMGPRRARRRAARLAPPPAGGAPAARRGRHDDPGLPRLAGLADRRASTRSSTRTSSSSAPARTDARVIACGHTHLPEVRDLGWKLIVNDGSAGYVFDGEPTASWARIDIDDGEITAEIRRTEFDALAVANAISARGLPGDVYRAATVRTGKLVR